MDPATEYDNVIRGHTHVLPMPISDALDRRAPELPLISNIPQQRSRVSTTVSGHFLLLHL